ALGAARERDVDGAAPDRTARLADRLCRRRARRLDRGRRARDAEARGEPRREVLRTQPLQARLRHAPGELAREARRGHGEVLGAARVRDRAQRSQVVPLAARADEDSRTRRPEDLAGARRRASPASAARSSIAAGSASVAAIWVGRPSGSKCAIRRTPEAPASAAFQNASRPTPIGVTTSRPVTTTRRPGPRSREEGIAAIDDE